MILTVLCLDLSHKVLVPYKVGFFVIVKDEIPTGEWKSQSILFSTLILEKQKLFLLSFGIVQNLYTSNFRLDANY